LRVFCISCQILFQKLRANKVTDVTPTYTVISIVTPADPPSIRAAFFENVHYFFNCDAARDWLAHHPGADLLSVGDAFAMTRMISDP
jgi:alkylmercury lyase